MPSSKAMSWVHKEFMRKISAILTIATSFALGACGLTAADMRQKKLAEIKKQADSIVAECDAKYPMQRGQLLNRMRCLLPAQKLYQPIAPYPDLLDQQTAAALVVAEKFDKGTITGPQAQLELAQLNSQLTAEQQRRDLANRSVMANEAMADEASRANTIAALNNLQRSINSPPPPTITCTHQPGAMGFPSTTTCQ
jgi:hypothetical protein